MKTADINQILARYQRGDFNREVSAALSKVVTELHEMSAQRPDRKFKGQIKISIDLAVKSGVAEIGMSYAEKIPQMPRGSDIMWTNPDGTLSDEHPKQISMFPRTIDGGKSEAEDIDPSTATG